MIQFQDTIGLDDSITGSEGNDTILAGAGDDTIHALGGADSVDAGDGHDVISGGAGVDTLIGGAGNDVFTFEDGETVGAGEVFEGGAGTDTLLLSFGTTFDGLTLDAGASVEVIDGSDGALFLSGTDGDNVFDLSGVSRLTEIYDIDLGGGHDRFVGGALDDLVFGGAGNDTFFGGDGEDELYGDGGDDLFVVDQTAVGYGEIYDGGDGVDTLRVLSGTTFNDLFAPGVEVIDATADGFLSGTAGEDNIELTDVTSMIGFSNIDLGLGHDTFRGGALNEAVYGRDGDDHIRGGDGSDTLVGDTGDDTLIGGESEDDLRDVIYAGAGADSVDGGYGNDELRGDAGDDTIAGGFGADTVIGGTGHDRLTGSAFADQMFGSDGDDFVNGGFGHDLLNGGSGADRFYHIGVADHGSDWVQDYNAADGDILQFGIVSATVSQFQVNTTHTSTAAGERSGDDAIEEAFVIYRPTGQIMWALVDGAGQSQINVQIGQNVFDLLA
ncbi:hypothetical protein CSC82_16335 [Rhodobacteraceae bacterium 4F10]|nr:hypothetical protein CSC82_16335 [Rhodobacteraceae bacterium 4F10]